MLAKRVRPLTQEVWLTEHSYLRSVAEFHSHVHEILASLPATLACVPNWDDYACDFLAGVPLLQSASSGIDLRPVEELLEALGHRLALTRLPDKLALEIHELDIELSQNSTFSRRALALLRDRHAAVPGHAGLLRFLGWTVMARYLSRVVDAFRSWREDEHWLRKYCPTCGSVPAMAQLIGIDPGRLRLLSCGCCGTRWRYLRAACPFCENTDDRQLGTLEVEDEAGLRIDYCESCKGYLKTLDGQATEFLLSDWSSFHLDVLARDRGLKPLANSLYQL